MSDTPTLVLASRSSVRAMLLENAGVSFRVEVSPVDEAEAKMGFEGNGTALAQHLAELKAQAVSAEARDQFVIGADQVLTCDARLLTNHEIWMRREKISAFFPRQNTHAPQRRCNCAQRGHCLGPCHPGPSHHA